MPGANNIIEHTSLLLDAVITFLALLSNVTKFEQKFRVEFAQFCEKEEMIQFDWKNTKRRDNSDLLCNVTPIGP